MKGNVIFKLLCFSLLSSGMAVGQQNSDSASSGPSVEAALLKTKADIDAASIELQQIRDEVSSQRVPLFEELESLQEEIKSLRIETERMRQAREQDAKEYDELVADVEAMEEEGQFVLNIFSEYRRSMETRANEAEIVLIAEMLKTVDDDLNDEESLSHLPAAAEALLKIAADLSNRRLGGMTFPGTVLDGAGFEHEGEFAVLGPVAFFAERTGSCAGLAVTSFGNTQPSLFDDFTCSMDERIADLMNGEEEAEEVADRIVNLLQGEEAIVPVDVSSGKALQITQARQAFLEHVKKGGIVIIPLLLCGGIALILALIKTIDLSLIRVRGNEVVVKILAELKKGNIEAAQVLVRKVKEPLASLVHEGVEHHAAPKEHLEEIMHEHVRSCLPRLERHLGMLAVLGGIAPLLGLLGTVTGMIHTFQLVTIFGSGDAKLLSSGISEALVTTEFGLAIAIPVLLMHALLSRRAKKIAGILEQTAIGLVNEIHIRSNGA